MYVEYACMAFMLQDHDSRMMHTSAFSDKLSARNLFHNKFELNAIM